MDAESPNKFAEIVDSSDDSSDDENVPLAMFRPALQKSTEEPAFEEPEDPEPSDFGTLISTAMRTIDDATAVVSC